MAEELATFTDNPEVQTVLRGEAASTAFHFVNAVVNEDTASSDLVRYYLGAVGKGSNMSMYYEIEEAPEFFGWLIESPTENKLLP